MELSWERYAKLPTIEAKSLERFKDYKVVFKGLNYASKVLDMPEEEVKPLYTSITEYLTDKGKTAVLGYSFRDIMRSIYEKEDNVAKMLTDKESIIGYHQVSLLHDQIEGNRLITYKIWEERITGEIQEKYIEHKDRIYRGKIYFDIHDNSYAYWKSSYDIRYIKRWQIISCSCGRKKLDSNLRDRIRLCEICIYKKEHLDHTKINEWEAWINNEANN